MRSDRDGEEMNERVRLHTLIVCDGMEASRSVGALGCNVVSPVPE